MSDRISHITVTLHDNMRDDDCEHVIHAIQMIKGVIDVAPHVADSAHYAAVSDEISAILWPKV